MSTAARRTPALELPDDLPGGGSQSRAGGDAAAAGGVGGGGDAPTADAPAGAGAPLLADSAAAAAAGADNGSGGTCMDGATPGPSLPAKKLSTPKLELPKPASIASLTGGGGGGGGGGGLGGTSSAPDSQLLASMASAAQPLSSSTAGPYNLFSYSPLAVGSGGGSLGGLGGVGSGSGSGGGPYGMVGGMGMLGGLGFTPGLTGLSPGPTRGDFPPLLSPLVSNMTVQSPFPAVGVYSQSPRLWHHSQVGGGRTSPLPLGAPGLMSFPTPRPPATLYSFVEPSKPPLAPGGGGGVGGSAGGAYDQQAAGAPPASQAPPVSQAPPPSQPPAGAASTTAAAAAAPPPPASTAALAPPPLQHPTGGGALPTSLPVLPPMRPDASQPQPGAAAGAPMGGPGPLRLSAGATLLDPEAARTANAMGAFARPADVPVAPLTSAGMLGPAPLRGGLHPMYAPYGQRPPAADSGDGAAAAAATAAAVATLAGVPPGAGHHPVPAGASAFDRRQRPPLPTAPEDSAPKGVGRGRRPAGGPSPPGGRLRAPVAGAATSAAASAAAAAAAAASAAAAAAGHRPAGAGAAAAAPAVGGGPAAAVDGASGEHSHSSDGDEADLLRSQHPPTAGPPSSALERARERARRLANDFSKDRKRKKQAENDAAIASAKRARMAAEVSGSEMSLQQLSELRYKRRLQLNRQSAAVSRVYRRQYTDELETELKAVETAEKKAAAEVAKLREENERLKGRLSDLGGAVPPIAGGVAAGLPGGALPGPPPGMGVKSWQQGSDGMSLS